MSVFTVISTRDNTASLEEAVTRSFPDDHYMLTDNVWLVSSPRTARQVAETIGATKGGTLSGVVVLQAAPAYYGLANTDVWDWLRSAIEKSAYG